MLLLLIDAGHVSDSRSSDWTRSHSETNLERNLVAQPDGNIFPSQFRSDWI